MYVYLNAWATYSVWNTLYTRLLVLLFVAISRFQQSFKFWINFWYTLKQFINLQQFLSQLNFCPVISLSLIFRFISKQQQQFTLISHPFELFIFKFFSILYLLLFHLSSLSWESSPNLWVQCLRESNNSQQLLQAGEKKLKVQLRKARELSILEFVEWST